MSGHRRGTVTVSKKNCLRARTTLREQDAAPHGRTAETVGSPFKALRCLYRVFVWCYKDLARQGFGATRVWCYKGLALQGSCLAAHARIASIHFNGNLTWSDCRDGGTDAVSSLGRGTACRIRIRKRRCRQRRHVAVLRRQSQSLAPCRRCPHRSLANCSQGGSCLSR